MNFILTITYILAVPSLIWGKTISKVIETDEIENPRYAFNYAVADRLTLDNKAQWEDRVGDKVNGPYSLLDPNANLRVLEYAADDLSGFSAIVKSIGDTLRSPQPYLASLIIPLPEINPFINPLTYGFGAAPIAVGVPKVKVSGNSLPWDPKTGSYGGWVPISGSPKRKIVYATIVSKKYVNGHLHKVAYGPIPLPRKSKILIKKKRNDD